jgi:hypothetical protein
VIETLDDIIEKLANELGVYGAHITEHNHGSPNCRVCWTMDLKDRIVQAVEIEKGLFRVQVPEVGPINGPGYVHPADVRKVDELEKRVASLEREREAQQRIGDSRHFVIEKRVAELERKLDSTLGFIDF